MKDSIQNQLSIEQTQYHDILQANFSDSYNNLTIKGWSILYWHEKVCGKKDVYQFWTTMDNFLLVNNLVALVKAKGEDWKRLPAIIGECHLIKVNIYRPFYFTCLTFLPLFLPLSVLFCYHCRYRCPCP